MPSQYSVELTDPFGNNGIVLDFLQSFSFARKVNNVGALVVTLPDIDSVFPLYKRDGRVSVWRSVESGVPYLEGETIWLIQNIERLLTERNEGLVRLTCVDLIDLLRRRIVAYPAGQSQSEKSATNADNTMKAVVRENLGSSASDTARDWSTHLSVQADTSLGASIGKSFSYRNVLKVLQELAEASTLAGTYLAFDIVASNPPSGFEFRTYSGQRGVDHRWPGGNNPVLIGPEFGNLADVSIQYDYASLASYMYALGQGEASLRQTATQSSTSLIAASPFGRVEDKVDARQTVGATALQDEADYALRQRRSRIIASGRLVDTDGVRYGVQYRFGDYLTAQYKQDAFDCRLDAYRIDYTRESGETLNAVLRGEV